MAIFYRIKEECKVLSLYMPSDFFYMTVDLRINSVLEKIRGFLRKYASDIMKLAYGVNIVDILRRLTGFRSIIIVKHRRTWPVL